MGLAPPATRRQELAEFLRDYRETTNPDAVGLAANGNRRTPGLRREEVSLLAGVGLSWYTWLEQGRDITPSVSVLDALARVYDLDPAERAHLFHLAGVALPVSATAYPVQAPAELRDVVEGLEPNPAYLIGDQLQESPRFRELWRRHEVLDAQLGTKHIEHPQLGGLTLHHLQSIPTSHPDLRLTQFVPAGAATGSALARA